MRTSTILLALIAGATLAAVEPATPRATLDTAPVVQRAPTPEAAARKSAGAQLRKLYKDQFAARKPAQKRAFAAKLRAMAASGDDAPAMRWAALDEALALSVAAEDVAGAIDALDATATGFSGGDPAAARRAALAKMHAPAAKALLTLIDHPTDAAASGEAGRYFCLDANRWDVGLPLLANADDKALADAAKLDAAAAKPTPATAAADLAAIGDAWYDVLPSLKKDAQRGAVAARSAHWYQIAFPKLTGIAHDRVEQRQIELFALIPDALRDYATMTAKQWEQLKGPTVSVAATAGRVDTKLALKDGQRVRIVANPDDTWRFTWLGKIDATCGWKGDEGTGKLLGRERGKTKDGQLVPGALAWSLDEGQPAEADVAATVAGPGKLTLTAFDPLKDAKGGAIRVKLVVTAEDD